MRIEKKDLEFLRKLELGIDLTKGIPDQVKGFQSAKIIDSFGIRFFIPPVIGGKWYFVLTRINGIDKQFVDTLEFPVEMGVNLSIPGGLLPEITISYYTQDPRKEEDVIKGFKPGYLEAKVLNEYDYPICLPLSQEEVKIIEVLIKEPIITMREIATKLNLSPATVRAKLTRLQIGEGKRGFINIVPSINWSRIENFNHLHIGIETGLSQEMLAERIKDFALATAGWYRGTICQLEFDLWKVTDLNNILKKISSIKDLRLAGLLFAQRSIVIDRWISNLIKEI